MSNRIREIKALMILRGTTITEIARNTGVTRVWVSMVVNEHRKSERIRRAIAEAVGKKVEKLWPENNKTA